MRNMRIFSDRFISTVKNCRKYPIYGESEKSPVSKFYDDKYLFDSIQTEL